MLFNPIKEKKYSKHKRTIMGAIPKTRGRSMFSIGTEAMLDIKIVTANSLGCKVPICLFPINRIMKMTKKYIKIVLKIEIGT